MLKRAAMLSRRSPSPSPKLFATLAVDDSDCPTFTFPEEPLGLSAAEGYGFFQGKPYEKLGPDGRFHLLGKLGIGMNSSVWLAKDQQLGGHVALKILSGYASQLNAEQKLRELTIHQRLSALPLEETKHCSQLVAHFKHNGIEKDGEHLCLALQLERSSLGDTRGPQPYSISIAKRILRHLLHGMAAVHKCGFAHTDIKPDNIMVSLAPSWTDKNVAQWAEEHDPHVYDSFPGPYKTITEAFVSQPLPAPSVAELDTCDFKLADFSNAQQLDDQTTDHLSPLTLRAPELILGGPWDETIDIWSFGCLVFTVLTRAKLFAEGVRANHVEFLRPGVDPKSEGLEVDYLLWSITVITGQRIPPSVLKLYPNSNEYFLEDGDMKRFDMLGRMRRPLETCVRDTGCLADEKDVIGACSLITRCLQVNPSARPSAQELLQDPWLQEL